MVHCIIVDCSSNSRKDLAIGFFRLPSIFDKQGEEAEELSRERREKWIWAISRDDIQWKNVLNVCEDQQQRGIHLIRTGFLP